MDIQRILEQLDTLFKDNELDQVEPYLLECLQKAIEQNDFRIQITLLNELTGFYRDIGRFKESCKCGENAVEIMETFHLTDTVDFGTTLLNLANAYRAAGRHKHSLACYEEVQRIYEQNLEAQNFLFASLYNNMSLLFQEMEDFETACEYLKKALRIAASHENSEIPVAISKTNLAVSLLKLDKVEEATEYLLDALGTFEGLGKSDFHYSAALSAMAEAKFKKGELDEAVGYYEKALSEIALHMGKNNVYDLTKQNLEVVLLAKQKAAKPTQSNVKINGMELCQSYYREYGASMIHSLFSEYETQIAVGMAGEGSECFGFDDEISKDHDFGPSFCMWVTDEVYNAIGKQLQEAYDNLPKSHRGMKRQETAAVKMRTGVIRISEFYSRILGMPNVPKDSQEWLSIKDSQFATAINGKVFLDNEGIFSQIRANLSSYYPREVWLQKLAMTTTLAAQTGQYNYKRMLQREDVVTAQIALSDFAKHMMQLIYLLNKQYAPYYKWMYHGLSDLPLLGQEAGAILRELSLCAVNEQEKVEDLVEKATLLVMDEFQRQGLTFGDDTYLDVHAEQIRALIRKEHNNNSIPEKAPLIAQIINLEWEAFDQVQNEGGRANCQDDFVTFEIMRKSQYLTWTVELLESFIADFIEANQNGRNLITEKYGRMMESTAPAEYEKIKDNFPVFSEERKQIMESIIGIQIGMMESFAKEYPKMARQSRSIYTHEDTLQVTSYETYLRGELATYSDTTLFLYGQFVVSLCNEQKNLARMTMEHTAKLYGYATLEEAERRMWSE